VRPICQGSRPTQLLLFLSEQVNVRVIPRSAAIDESVELAHEIFIRVFRKVPSEFPRVQMATSGTTRMLFCRIVVQVLAEPSLDLRHAHPLAFVIVGDLIAVDLAEAEISRFRVGEVDPTHAGAGPHCK
jgi:hypothetical protein